MGDTPEAQAQGPAPHCTYDSHSSIFKVSLVAPDVVNVLRLRRAYGTGAVAAAVDVTDEEEKCVTGKSCMNEENS